MSIKSRRTIRSALAVLVLGLMLSGCATERGPEAAALAQRIESARTRADHEGLASYYEQEANTARQMADKHRRMRDSYRPLGGSPRGAGGVGLLRHCETLIESSEKAAVEYSALAGLHRKMAVEAKE